jgi:hypothetical protein
MKTKLLLIPIIAFLTLFAVAPIMAAPVTKTPFTAEATFITGNVSPGKMWTTKDNILQVRESISAGNVTGDITGTVLLVEGETLDMNTGLGVNHGKFTITVAEGTYEGSFRSTFTGLNFTGTFVGKGTGTLEGQKIKGSYEGQVTYIDTTIPLAHMTINGIILSP